MYGINLIPCLPKLRQINKSTTWPGPAATKGGLRKHRRWKCRLFQAAFGVHSRFFLVLQLNRLSEGSSACTVIIVHHDVVQTHTTFPTQSSSYTHCTISTNRFPQPSMKPFLNNLGSPFPFAFSADPPTDLESSYQRIGTEKVCDFLKIFDGDVIYVGNDASVKVQLDERSR